MRDPSRISTAAISANTPGLKHGELTQKIIGVFFDVYNELGHGFLESVYEDAMVKADIVVEGKIVLELKTARTLDPTHEAQLLHYLKATEFEIGLLLNFGSRPQFRRLILDNDEKRIRLKPNEVSV